MSTNYQHARKISRSQLKAYCFKWLKTDQEGKCPICGKTIDLTTAGHKSDYVVDHNHLNGLVRGVLCRGCNGALGKMQAAIARWGKTGYNYDKIIEFMEKAISYYRKDPYPVIYPDHKTEEEKLQIKKQKAARAEALRKARKKLREQEKNEGN